MDLRELPIPAEVAKDLNSIEILRIWISDEQQKISLATSVWEDPAAWGIMLVDLAKHVASSYQHTDGIEFEDALSRLREGFDAEWNHATDQPSGGLQD